MSFACTAELPDSPLPFSFAGHASAQTDLGPYGIGATFDVFASGTDDDAPQGGVLTETKLSVTWSQDFVIEGAQGSGFVDGTMVRNFWRQCFREFL